MTPTHDPGRTSSAKEGGALMPDAVKAEKIGWYREVLDLEPGSKVFLPFARLLEETGRDEEAVTVLRQGLEKHPEFIEARLYLIDILHRSGQSSLCGAEVARLAGLFREYPGFWEAWGALEETADRKPDLSVSLNVLGAMFRNCDITFVDVLSAGIRVLQEGGAKREGDSRALSERAAESAPGAAPHAGGTVPLPAADDRGGDSSSVDDSAPPFVFREASGPVAGETPETSPGGEKCSLRTRSMAEVLAEQGDLRGAAEIYEELLSLCRPVDRPALTVRLEELRARLGEQDGVMAPGGTGMAVPTASSQPRKISAKPRNGVLDLLEKLAVRLENKARQ